MKYDKIEGLDRNISKLIMGNDNQTYFDEASKLWDKWMEVGGNAFDTAHIYGGGSMEKLLGCLLYTSPSPRDRQKSRMPSSA